MIRLKLLSAVRNGMSLLVLRNSVDFSSVFALIYALVLNFTVFHIVKMEAVSTTFEVGLDLAALYFAIFSLK